MITKRYIDLHVHTSCSDGVFSPRDAVRFALKAGLAAISITDHDTVEGIPEALDEGKKLGIEIVPGVELSTELNLPAKSEMHILGYFIDWENLQFRESLMLFQKARQQRAIKILDKLEHLGVRLDRERLFAIAGEGSIGRLHFAKALIEEGYVRSIGEAFQRYLGLDKSAYVPKLQMKPDEAIRLITRTGGIAVLAHPFYGHYSNRTLLGGLIRDGLRGIEVWHSKHSPSTVDMFMKLARELQLLPTGGSDCHGIYDGEPALMGTVRVPYEVLAALKNCKETIGRENTGVSKEQ